ncbi:MAG: sialate O-acetylesterase [Ruminococcaceae bacterium]|nr:sialate O-acetylesterase [Oscillospiraceae bacterium]
MIRDGINELQQQVSGILMIGQSNMAGRGEMGDVEPIDNPNCLMLRIGRWQRMLEPINPDRSMFVGLYRSGVGLAASFADDYAKYSGGKVGLIPCADGGTCLGQWMPGEMDYDYAVALASLAKRICTLRGIIWHQGESDCADEALIDTYKERFIRMITQLRRDLGDETLPVVIGELHPNPKLTRFDPARFVRLNEIFREIVQELPYCALASAEGLSLKPDGIHFDSVSLREFGHRYFTAFQTLIEK